MEEIKWKEYNIKISLCQKDILVVFNLAEGLLPKKRKILDKTLKKLPSRIINFKEK